jgi:hypothetical protein
MARKPANERVARRMLRRLGMQKKVCVTLLASVLAACEAHPLDGEELEVEASALSGSMVGVIPDKGVNCPGQRIEISVAPEMEDNNNHKEGWVGDWTWNNDAMGRMVYCKVPSSAFKAAKSTSTTANYGLLKLGASCPEGSFEVVRYFDLEDRRYAPSTSEEDKTYPPSRHGGLSGQNLWLHLCVFKAHNGGSSSPFPDLGFKYGVLGSPGVPGDITSGFAYNDDEDDNNHTRWEWNDENVNLDAIIEGKDNSKMKLVRVR